MIHDLRFRHIRYVSKKNKFVKIKKKFYSFNHLLEFLNNKYLDAYYSTSLWLNPNKIGPRLKENKYKEFFLGMDLVFDIDEKRKDFIKNITKAKQETIKLLKIGKEKKWKLNYICFSGSKGFHISYKLKIPNISDPYEREERYKEKVCEIAEEIEKKVNIDTAITKDTRRIIRIPYTYNSKTGFICTPLLETDLRLDTKKLLLTIRRKKFINRLKESIIRGKDLMTELRNTSENWFNGWFSPNQPQYVVGISSNVGKTKRHVLVLEFPSYYNIRSIKKELEGYPGIFIKNKLFISFMSYLSLDKTEIEHIMKKTKSKNLSAFRKYKHVIFKYQILDKNYKEIESKKIFFNCEVKKRPISKEHYNFINGKKANVVFRIMKIQG